MKNMQEKVDFLNTKTTEHTHTLSPLSFIHMCNDLKIVCSTSVQGASANHNSGWKPPVWSL